MGSRTDSIVAFFLDGPLKGEVQSFPACTPEIAVPMMVRLKWGAPKGRHLKPSTEVWPIIKGVYRYDGPRYPHSPMHFNYVWDGIEL